MCFHSALGDVQIASDFRIVTALKQQIDNLPLPLSYVSKLLFHALTSTDALGPLHEANRPSGPMHTPRFVIVIVSFSVHPRSQSPLTGCQNCENP